MAGNIKILALLIVLGFGLRMTQLGAIGFAEDEVNKLDAIQNRSTERCLQQWVLCG